MKKKLIKAMVAGTLFASLLSFVGYAEGRDNEVAKMFDSMGIKMVSIPERNFKMLNTEVTQKLYTSVMGSNPSYHEGDNNPVECVSWYDAIYFCNKLSEKFGFTPVYAVDGETDVATWNYTPHSGFLIRGEVIQNTKANGFRLPTEEEWEYAARGGQNYTYSGSNNIDKVGWYYGNSGDETHPVARKKSNGYGLYDMSGNVEEWCWDVDPNYSRGRCCRGGGYGSYAFDCTLDDSYYYASHQCDFLGFRIVCSALGFEGYAKGQSIEKAKKSVARDNEVARMIDSMGIKMVSIPEKNFKMLNTEVTQKLYASVMGSNPSHYKGENKPVECVSWYDAIYFCNKLSEKLGFTPVYAVDGKTDVTTWNYVPHRESWIDGKVRMNDRANGFRLPTEEEWEYAARGGQNYTYSGSNNIDEVGWYYDNSGDRTHPVAQKKSNGYGLYDMSGNVEEWCWDVDPDDGDYRYDRGGCCSSYYVDDCKVDYRNDNYASYQYDYLGFRIVCSADN